jgi:hypothetical protein
MTLLLIIPVWLLLLGLVVGLCTAARVGDTLESCEPRGGTVQPPSRPRADERAPLSHSAGRMHAGNIAA